LWRYALVLPTVATRYARGVGLANAGDLAAARGELDAIASLEQTADFSNLIAGYVPAKEILQVAQHVVRGRIAQAGKDYAGAVTHFKAAVAVEDTLAYSELPYWYYPIRQSLGAAQVLANDLDSAENTFRESLARAPNNGWALYGLTQVYKSRGDQANARAAQKLLDKAWLGQSGALNLAKL
jgi:tetratricopeptide (TPR) repeat protein